jgi:hypothetical protein
VRQFCALHAAADGGASGTLTYWGASLGDDLVTEEARIDLNTIHAGWWHGSVLCNQKNVLSWGDNGLGQLEVAPPAMTGPCKQVAVGRHHTLALMSNGSVVQWGDAADVGPMPPEAAAGNVASIHAGDAAAFAIMGGADGRVLGWGKGLGAIAPLLPSLNGGMVQEIITTRRNGFLILFRNSTLLNYTHGAGETPPSRPVVTTGVTWIAASFADPTADGPPHFLAVVNNSAVLGWGDDANGRVSGPMSVTAPVARVATGGHSLVLLRNGSVLAFGRNDFGQCDVPLVLRENRAVQVRGFFLLSHPSCI